MRSITLSQPWRKLLLTLHIGGGVAVLGADFALVALGAASLGGANPVTIYPAARLVAATIIAPLALVTLASGVLLALLTPWGLFRYWWTAIKLAIVLVLSAAVTFVLVPALGATAEAVSGPTPRILGASERLPLVLAPAGASLLLVIALVLGVFKPSWRLSSRAGAPSPIS